MYRKTLLMTAGYASIVLGLYLIHKGSDDISYFTDKPSTDNIIEAEWFEVED